MQTFLPLENYYESMKCLDKSRLGNQVWREGLTLLRGKWPNHPASKMWRGHEYHLGLYLLAGLQVLRERKKNKHAYGSVELKIKTEMEKFTDTGKPPFIGNDTFHASHRSNLLRKNKEYYSQFGWVESDSLPYYWPVK